MGACDRCEVRGETRQKAARYAFLPADNPRKLSWTLLALFGRQELHGDEEGELVALMAGLM